MDEAGVLKEKEFFLQEHAVTKKNTEKLTRAIKNEANEIIQKGNDEAKKIVVISEAEKEKEKEVQSSYATALKGLFSTLNVTQEDHKLSLMLVRAMEDSVDNLYSGYGFEKNTLYTP